MKKLLLTILTISVALPYLAGCDKLPCNGNLDGIWQLCEVGSKTSLADASYAQITDKRDKSIFWSFQLQLLSMTSASFHNGHTSESVARFVYDDERLELTKIYIHFRDRDSLVTDPNATSFAEVGIRGCTAQFRIAQLNDSRLTLCSEMDSLVFHKVH